MKLKKLLLIPLLALTLGAAVGCSVDTSEKLTVWTFTSELSKIGRQYENKFGKKVFVKTWGDVESVVSQLIDALDSGGDIPDVVALEAAVVRDLDIQPLLTPLNDITGTDQMYDYTKNVASDENGNIFGLSWQATPGGFFYKKRVADKLNLSEEQIASYLSTWDGFMSLGQLCLENSVKIVSSITEPIKVFMSDRQKAWVDENNVLQLEKVMFGPTTGSSNCFDVVRGLEKKGYTHKSTERDDVWYADINSDTCLGYFASCWGLQFDLMENATVKSGWRMCKAPVNYFKGGTWLCVPKESKKIAEAKEFIKYVTTDEEFLAQRCEETGDFMNNKQLMNSIVADYQCPYLDGQNHYAQLIDVANQINGNLISPFDAFIDESFRGIVAEFAMKAGDDEIEAKRTKYKNDFRSVVKRKYNYLDTESYPND